jgi:hypothetical protein
MDISWRNIILTALVALLALALSRILRCVAG